MHEMTIWDWCYGYNISNWGKFPELQMIDSQMYGSGMEQWVLDEYNSSL